MHENPKKIHGESEISPRKLKLQILHKMQETVSSGALNF